MIEEAGIRFHIRAAVARHAAGFKTGAGAISMPAAA